MDTRLSDALLEKSLECNYRYQWEIRPPRSHFSDWRSFPTPMISLMLSGKAEIQIRGRRPLAAIWNEGEVTCLLPSMTRFIRVLSAQDVFYCGVAAQFSILNGVDPLSFFDLPVVYPAEQSKAIGQTLHEIIAAARIDNLIKKAVTRRALCTRLLQLLLEPASIRPDSTQRLFGAGRLSPAVRQLVENYSEKPDIDHLARLSFLSRSRFHVVFRNTLGCTPYDLLKKVRLDKAAILLASTSDSVAEIGRTLGWSDQFHFSRTFKSFFGVSPQKYRENTKSGRVL